MTEKAELGVDGEERGLRFSPPVYQQRYDAVTSLVKRLRPRKVVDMGCGECKLLRLLKAEDCIEKLTGVDIDGNVLDWKKYLIQPLTTDYLFRRPRPLHVALFEGSIATPDVRMDDTDLCCCIEVIEHLEDSVLRDVPRVIFGAMRPRTAIFSTPNADYNVLFPNFSGFRHWDHKFEWSRSQFQKWCLNVCWRYGYTVRFDGVGDPPPESSYIGYCSQIAVFTRRDQEQSCSCLRLSDTGGRKPYKLIYECDHPWDDTDPIEKLSHQAEYYINFLRKCPKGSGSEDGASDSDSQASSPWIDLCELLKFRPVKKLCSSATEISFALRTHSQIVRVSSDGTQAKLHERSDSSTSSESSWETESPDHHGQLQTVGEAY